MYSSSEAPQITRTLIVIGSLIVVTMAKVVLNAHILGHLLSRRRSCARHACNAMEVVMVNVFCKRVLSRTTCSRRCPNILNLETT